jgi:hypothetical protein
MPFIFCLLIAWYLVYRAGGDLATGAARVTAAAADRLASTAEHLGERGEGLRQRATATATKLRDRPAPTTPRTHAGQGLGDDLAGVLGAVIGWLRLVWVDAAAAAESAQARRAAGPHAMWWRWPTGDEPQAPIHADAERLDRTDEATVTDPPAVDTGADLGWMGYASTAGRQLISENACAWGGGAGPFCGAPRDGDSPFCPQHTRRYADEFGHQPDPAPAEPSTPTSTSGGGDWTGEVDSGGTGTPTASTTPATGEGPVQATAERLDTTPALPAASSDRLAITDGRNEMETAAESGLGEYLRYSTDMANSCQDGVNSIDTTIGALETQDWSGEPIEALGRAKEALATAGSALEDAHAAFQRALAVTDAYAANNHAGTKDSVTAV